MSKIQEDNKWKSCDLCKYKFTGCPNISTWRDRRKIIDGFNHIAVIIEVL